MHDDPPVSPAEGSAGEPIIANNAVISYIFLPMNLFFQSGITYDDTRRTITR